MKSQHFVCLVTLLALPILVNSCESTTEPQSNSTTAIVRNHAIFVLNEGAYSKSNGSLDLITLDSVARDTSYTADVLTGLGVGNDLKVFGDRLYVLDNAKNSITVLSLDSLKTAATLSFGLETPNTMTLIDSNMMLVTMLYSTHADIVDLSSMTIVDTIGIGEGSVASTVLYGKAFITSGIYGGAGHLTVYDLKQRKIVATSTLLTGAGPIVSDSTLGIVLAGSVGEYGVSTGRIYWVDANSNLIQDSLNTTSTTSSLVLLSGGGLCFALDGGTLKRLDVSGHRLLSTNITDSYYNGAYDATREQLYLGHNDFSGNRGIFDVYDVGSSSLLWSDTAGIAPAHFAFYH